MCEAPWKSKPFSRFCIIGKMFASAPCAWRAASRRTKSIGRTPTDKFTLGDILRHLAVAERFMWAENVQCRPARYTTHGKELADGYENVMAFVERLHAESMEIFAQAHRRRPSAQMQDSRRCAHHHMEMASPHARARNPSPRADLYVSGNVRSKDARRSMA